MPILGLRLGREAATLRIRCSTLPSEIRRLLATHNLLMTGEKLQPLTYQTSDGTQIPVWGSEIVFKGYSLTNVHLSFKISPSSRIFQNIYLSMTLLTYSGFRLGRTYVELPPQLDIWVLVAQWLQDLTGHQKVVGSIPAWGSEIVFLRLGLDESSSIIRDISKLPHFPKYISQRAFINSS